MVTKFTNYKELLSKTYEEAIDHLIDKYGGSEADYYSEKSYKKFLNGEIKNITKGKFTRTDEGLYCHHIDEKSNLNLSDKWYIKELKYPFKFQKKERLVYCDLIEHGILHVLIAKEEMETGKIDKPLNYIHGLPGFDVFIGPNIEEWYLLQKLPQKQWMLNCYNKAYLDPEEAFELLKDMKRMINESYPETLEKYHEKRKNDQLENELRREALLKIREEDRLNQIERAKELTNKSPRELIVRTLYSLKYIEEFDYKQFDQKMKVYIKDKILEEIQIYINKAN